MIALPEYYFRIRDNGAAVFRVDVEDRHRRIDMQQIAVVHTNRGDFKPYGDHVLTAADETVILDWIAARKTLQARRELEDLHRTIEQLNLAAHWAQTHASDADLEAVTDELLLAMHDLRSVLVRKKSDRLAKPD